MTQILSFELEQSRKRLDYYSQLKAKSGMEKSKALQKWIEIYAERVQKLERQVSKASKAAAAGAAPAKGSRLAH